MLEGITLCQQFQARLDRLRHVEWLSDFGRKSPRARFQVLLLRYTGSGQLALPQGNKVACRLVQVRLPMKPIKPHGLSDLRLVE